MNADSFLLTWILFGQKPHGKRKSFWALRKVWGFLLYNVINPDKHNNGTFEIFKPFQLNLQTSTNTIFSLDQGAPRCMVARCVCAVRLLGFRVMGGQRAAVTVDGFFLGVARIQRCVQVQALFNTLWQSAVLSTPFCVSLFLSSFQICFWNAVHLSAQCSNWPPTPTAKAHGWYPSNPAAMEHLWYRSANPDE